MVAAIMRQKGIDLLSKPFFGKGSKPTRTHNYPSVGECTVVFRHATSPKLFIPLPVLRFPRLAGTPSLRKYVRVLPDICKGGHFSPSLMAFLFCSDTYRLMQALPLSISTKQIKLHFIWQKNTRMLAYVQFLLYLCSGFGTNSKKNNAYEETFNSFCCRSIGS